MKFLNSSDMNGRNTYNNVAIQTFRENVAFKSTCTLMVQAKRPNE